MKRKKNILIVEDDVSNQKIYKAIFSKDYALKFSCDDEEFYSALKENEFDLFIVDLALNGNKNGIDLIKELRETKKYKNSPIIVVTAFVHRVDKEIAMVAGATNFISKPFDIKVLLAEIKKYLE